MRNLFAVFFAVTALSLTTTQTAQAAEVATNDIIEEILVLARFEEESLQEAPVAVTAIGEDAIEAFRIDEATDLLSRIPALNVSVGGSGAGAQITLRGIGSSFISNAFDSAVALNYDGVSVSTQRLLQSAFFDVDQVAVLKGPQSLYFGKAASAGVLSLRSANPTEEWEGSIRTSYEFEEEGTTIGGHISGPITDTLGMRIAAEYQEIDQFVEIAPGNPTRNSDRGLENFIARGTLHWEPNDRFSANLKINYNSQDSDALNQSLDIFCGGDGLPDPSVLLGGAFGGTPGLDLFLPTHDCDIDDGEFVGPDGHPAITTVPTGSPGEGRDISVAYNDTDTWFTRLEVDFAMTDEIDITFVGGYVDLENEYNDTFNSTGQLAPGVPAGLSAPFENTLEQTSLELRVSSNFDGPVNFQIGTFWEDRDIGHRTSQNAFNPSLLGAFGPPFGPDPSGATFDWLADRPIEAEAFSVFTSVEWDITDRLQLSGGVRWTDEEKTTSVAFPFVHAGVVALFGTVTSGFQSPDIEFQDDNWSPEVVLRYQINDDISVYGAYKTGFKSGGLDNNTLPTGAVVGLISPDPDVVAATVALLEFESEESEGFEVGIRSQFMDRALTVNATAYRYEYENQQVQQFDPLAFAFRTFNAGEVTTAGLEVDFLWATEIPGLTLSGSWAYLDAEITGALTAPGGGASLEGRDAGFSPELSGNLAINWETEITDGIGLRISPNIAYKDDYFVGGTSRLEFDAATNPLGDLVQDSFTTIDLNVSVYSMDDTWQVSLIGRNLTDEQYLTFAGPAPFRPPTGDDQLVGIGRGQQVFVEAAYRF